MGGAQPIGDGELEGLFDGLAAYRTMVIAVSGGADSMALMHLAARWRGARQGLTPELVAATVDHRLRAGSAGEARLVSEAAARLGIPHRTLSSTAPQPGPGLQEAAREMRYRLLAGLAVTLEPPCAILTAHHMADQAETLLMRLARGSGVDGLAGMRARSAFRRIIEGERPQLLDAVICRPLLCVDPDRLRATLVGAGLDWIEDPSNANEAFERIRLRRALEGELARIGLGREPIAAAAARLGRAREALEAVAASFVDRHVNWNNGLAACIAGPALQVCSEDVQIRILQHVLAAMGGQPEPARLSRIETLWHSLAAWQASRTGPFKRTLAGAVVLGMPGGHVMVWREVRGPLPLLMLSAGQSGIWDRRFEVSRRAAGAGWADGGPIAVRALGLQGISQLGETAAAWLGRTQVPRRALQAAPGLWRGDELLGCPLLESEAVGPVSDVVMRPLLDRLRQP